MNIRSLALAVSAFSVLLHCKQANSPGSSQTKSVTLSQGDQIVILFNVVTGAGGQAVGAASCSQQTLSSLNLAGNNASQKFFSLLQARNTSALTQACPLYKIDAVNDFVDAYAAALRTSWQTVMAQRDPTSAQSLSTEIDAIKKNVDYSKLSDTERQALQASLVQTQELLAKAAAASQPASASPQSQDALNQEVQQWGNVIYSGSTFPSAANLFVSTVLNSQVTFPIEPQNQPLLTSVMTTLIGQARGGTNGWQDAIPQPADASSTQGQASSSVDVTSQGAATGN